MSSPFRAWSNLAPSISGSPASSVKTARQCYARGTALSFNVATRQTFLRRPIAVKGFSSTSLSQSAVEEDENRQSEDSLSSNSTDGTDDEVKVRKLKIDGLTPTTPTHLWLQERVRALMRHVPHPIAIITSTDTTTSLEDTPSSWRGATVSSFNTVTLSQNPIVSFNLERRSSTYQAIKSSGLFNVCLLPPQKSSARLAATFTRGNESAPFHNPENGEVAGFVSWQSRTPDHDTARDPPLLATYPIPATTLHCKCLLEKTVEIGDHLVLFGKVTATTGDVRKIKPERVYLYYVNRTYSTQILPSDSGSEAVPQKKTDKKLAIRRVIGVIGEGNTKQQSE